MTRGGCGQEKMRMSLAQDGKREKFMLSYLTSQSSQIQTDVPSNFTDHCNLVPYWNQETPIPERKEAFSEEIRALLISSYFLFPFFAQFFWVSVPTKKDYFC